MTRYRIRFFFDWQCTPFWSGNDEAWERFGYLIRVCSKRFDTQSNWGRCIAVAARG